MISPPPLAVIGVPLGSTGSLSSQGVLKQAAAWVMSSWKNGVAFGSETSITILRASHRFEIHSSAYNCVYQLAVHTPLTVLSL